MSSSGSGSGGGGGGSSWLRKWMPWRKEATYEPLESRTTPSSASSASAVVAGGKSRYHYFSMGGVAALFLTLLLLVFVSSRWIDGTALSMATSWSHQSPRSRSHRSHHKQSKPIAFSCPNQTDAPVCCPTLRKVSPSPSPSPSPLPSPFPAATEDPESCPDYFRWIYEDLRPWQSTGITREMVEGAQKFAAFRLLVINGTLYLDQYHRVFQTRDLFTLWGIVQLANRYPGLLPDLDLMFNCEDMPTVMAADYSAASPPPPLFRYCKNDQSMDIVFPDWSFWGWPEINIKPWGTLSDEMRAANERVKWNQRIPYAFWKGNTGVSGARQDLMKCKPSHRHDWKARVFDQDWGREIKNGFKASNLAEQCIYRYKIFIEGRAWSVSEKYVLACDSPALFVTTHFYDFITRGLMPGQHFWPIRESDKCRSIKFAVDWGNTHQQEAQAIGKQGSNFVLDEVSMDYVYQYMFHLLTAYAKLLRYKPTLTEKATPLCLESLACREGGKVKEFLSNSMEKWTSDSEPCAMPPPYSQSELEELRTRKRDAIKQVEKWEQEAWDKGH